MSVPDASPTGRDDALTAMAEMHERQMQVEEEATAELYRLAHLMAEAVRPIKHIGGSQDGDYCWIVIQEVLREVYGDTEARRPPAYVKAKITRALSKRVMERDAYRCVTCGTHRDLSCDHVIPESKGGPTTFENLQTMCRPCNSRKGNR